MRGHRDLGAVCVAAILAALVAALAPWEPIRLLAALPLAIFLPGYAIAAAAFGPRRMDLQRLTMLVLLCGLSLLCLGGIVLNYLPGGLRTLTWVLLLVLVVLAAARAAALRRGKADPRPPARSRPRLSAANMICILLAVAASAGAMVFAQTPLPASNAVGYTALWMLPGDEAADPVVKVGVISAEQEPRLYRLQVRVGEGGEPTIYQLALEPGEERVLRIPVELDPGEPTRIAASLYDTERPRELYRRVTTWASAGLEPDEG